MKLLCFVFALTFSFLASAAYNPFVVTSRGSSGSDVQSVYFGGNATCSSACTTGTCTICNQVGNKITSVTWASSNGLYDVNGIDGAKYNCIGNGYAASAAVAMHERISSTSSKARINFYTANTGSVGNVGFASVVCFGIP